MFSALAHGYQLPGADVAQIAACEARLGYKLPEDYRGFLGVSNGFSDTVGHGYLVLWSVDELVAGLDYAVLDATHSGILIGSNGGPTAYAIIGGVYVAVPFVSAGPLESEMRRLGDDFAAFIAAIARGDGW